MKPDVMLIVDEEIKQLGQFARLNLHPLTTDFTDFCKKYEIDGDEFVKWAHGLYDTRVNITHEFVKVPILSGNNIIGYRDEYSGITNLSVIVKEKNWNSRKAST